MLKARRELDTSRNRELESVDDINIHQEIALQTAIIITRSIGSSLTIVENKEDNLQENIERIKNTINLVSKP